ncbi:MAG TPA: hypothetical protein VKB51_00135 [bacterium]|nr:hypothetical protein [bacterium]
MATPRTTGAFPRPAGWLIRVPEGRALRALGLGLAALLLAAAPIQAQSPDTSFDVSEFEKSPFRLGGFAELDAWRLTMNPDGALYHLTIPETEQPAVLHNYGAKLQLEGGYAGSWLSFNFRVQGAGTRDELGSESDLVTQEAYLAAKPSATSTVELGKRVTKWGKGYAWNPVAFVDRPKDPNDPDLSQEGFVMARAEVIRSFAGDLRNAAFTLVLLPVSERLNTDFGAEKSVNVAGKLTLLAWDTDVDLVALGGGTRTSRFGLDFSRNLGSNVEVHGEWARLSEVQRPVLQSGGGVVTETGSATAWLLGVRYLTSFDLTTIAEVYFNGAGYTKDELATYYRFVDDAWNAFESGGSHLPLDQAAALLQGAYGRPNPGRRYGYLRLSQKEPFGWLYVTPGVIAIANLDDHSRMVTAELSYTGITNVDVRARLLWFQGDPYTEFAEKPYARRAELRAQWYF